ncbi:MAG: DUF456 family protein [Gemmatimonadetes bacterium]|nr:DUF456 family protein [Gemmatimonadota bacterium]
MEANLLTMVAIAAMLVALLLIPLGLPGLWLMLAILAVGAWAGRIGLALLLLLVLLAALAELAEFLLVKRLSARYGGSNRAFWGAVAGGILGVLIGLPVPVVGALAAGLLGTFAGAALVALLESRQLGAATRVGWGAVLGRAFSAAVKVAVGIVILVAGGVGLVVG